MNLIVLFSALPTVSVAAGVGMGAMMAGGLSSAAEPPAGPARAVEAVAVETEPTSEVHETGHDDAIAPTPDRVVQFGRITVPVQKARSVTYVVAELGVSMQDDAKAADVRTPKTALRLRGALLAAMTEAAEMPVMRGVSIDTDALAADITRRIAQDFDGVDDVLFLSFYKADVPRV